MNLIVPLMRLIQAQTDLDLDLSWETDKTLRRGRKWIGPHTLTPIKRI